MNERTKRKDWIKNVAIIFLIVMLILTFFSNTIMNYSLPEVAAQYCMSGQITNKVRGTGMVEAQDPYKVLFNQSRKISSVAVRSGDTVEKGDVLYYLEDGESEELKEALKQLEELKAAYDKSIVMGQISSSVTSKVESGKVETTAEKQKAISNYQSKITKNEKTIKSYETTIANFNTNISNWTYDTSGAIQERVDLENAQKELAAWRAQKNITEAMVANAVTQEEIDYANLCNSTATIELAKAENKVASCEKVISDTIAAFESEKAKVQKQLEDAQATLADNQAKLAALLEKYSVQYELQDKLNEIAEKEKQIEKLKEGEGGNEIVAPVSGMVIGMNYSAGETINAGDEVSSIQVAGKGMTLTMTVTAQQAALLTVGDEAEVTNSWWYSDIHARISAIKPDPSNPSKSKIVVFDVMGDASSGQSLSLIVGRRTANYDVIVPTSAIREDNNGKFVYRVISKSTPLGVRYYAERVDVTVLAEDDTTSAISGDLSGWEYIITTSTAPIEDGKQIRLKD